MTDIEQKSIKVQLELSNEIISAYGGFVAHLNIAASVLLDGSGAIRDSEKARSFLCNLKDWRTNDKISGLCAEYIQEINVKTKILNKFK